MCGIAGIYHFRRPGAEESEVVRRMTDAMAHRGPDSDGFFVAPGIALGHRRLSIIDLSETANQPFFNSTGSHVLAFNGELYNFQQVKAGIHDCQWRTTSDTEVLAEAFVRKGIACIDAFKGMFSFAVWDKQRELLTVARDRMGVKPLYYYKSEEVFVFASEIRSILASGYVKPKLNGQALVDYFSYQSVSSPITIIEEIHQLEAGHYIEVGEGRFSVKSYWDITRTKSNFQFESRKEITDHIRQLLIQSVEGRMISDVPIGAFLSGGIDSSAVVALMATVSTSPVSTFNVSFTEKDFDESEYAELVAKKFNTRHERIELKPSVMLTELENALNAMDTPSGDGINTYVVSKAVKNAGLTVALSGIGGDELFAGYPFFKKFIELNRYRSIWNHSHGLRKLLSTAMPSGTSRAWRMKKLLEAKSTRIEHVYPLFRKIMAANQVPALANISGEAVSELEKKYLSKSSYVNEFPLLSQLSIAEFMGYTQQTLLKDTDQMSMAVSLEVREPFFDHELVEYILNIPDTFKFPHTPKQLLVESMGDLLLPEIVHRKKQGFSFPWELWMKKELKDFCETYLKRIADRSFIDSRSLMDLWQRFLRGDRRVRWMEIWLFVILERWLEKNGVQ